MSAWIFFTPIRPSYLRQCCNKSTHLYYNHLNFVELTTQLREPNLLIVHICPPLGTALARALKQAGREDVLRQSMQNISLVQNDRELSHAVQSLELHEPSPDDEDAMSKFCRFAITEVF